MNDDDGDNGDDSDDDGADDDGNDQAWKIVFGAWDAKFFAWQKIA